MQSTTKNRQSGEQLAAMLRHSLGASRAAEVVGIRELTDGWFNAAYEACLADGGEVVVKVAPHPAAEVMSYERNIMATEVATMRLVAPDPRIPVPRVLAHDESLVACDSPYFVMERVAGENLEHCQQAMTPEQSEALQLEVGWIIAAINSFTGTRFGYDGNPELQAATWEEAFALIVDSVLADARAKEVDLPADQVHAALARHARSLREVVTPQLVHWDAWNPNFFVRDGRISGLIDFERALWADPLMEAQFRPLSWGGVTPAMRGYGWTMFTASEIRRARLYTMHLALVMHTECYYRGFGPDMRASSRDLLVTNLDWLMSN